MLKTLKITSIFVAIAALAVVVVLVIFGLKGDVGIEKYLGLPGAVEKFRELATPGEGQQDATSPLVNETLAFVLRIDPPPPKAKPRPKAPKRAVTKKRTKKKLPPPPKPKKPEVKVKFKLVATCRYNNRPEESLALLNLTSKGNKWFRQGEEVGHLVIQEIKDGSIVLYKDGLLNSEISTPKVASKIRSLLRSDQKPSKSTSKPADPSVAQVEFKTVETSLKTASQQELVDPSVVKVGPETGQPSKKAVSTKPRSAAAAALRRTPNRRVTRRRPKPASNPRPRPAPKPKTPEEKKASITKTISGAKDAMNRTKGEDTEDSMKLWQFLLDDLEKDKSEAEKEVSEAAKTESKAKKEEKAKK